jgi:release factor glutamine methyltransferase
MANFNEGLSMRIGSNKVRELQSFFHRELSEKFDSGEIDAMFMMAAEHYMGWNRTEVHKRSNENLNQSDLLKLYDCAKAVRTGKPIQYVLGEAWFMDMLFYVNPSVLIPRPETEELVNIALQENKSHSETVLDIGTGSGCIAVSLKKMRPGWQVLACDISPQAIVTAVNNAKRHNTDVGFFTCDILSENIGGQFTIIISNPPYISVSESADMEPHVVKQEPAGALFAPGDDPVIFYKKIIDLCKEHLSDRGMLFFELNPLTASAVLAHAERSALFSNVNLLKDMSGNTRFFYARKK